MSEDKNLLKPKQRILRVAKELFNTHGYSVTSVRNIATTAHVDPALIIRHFGSKELLFLEAMTITSDNIYKGLGTDKHMIGENIVRFIFGDGDDIKSVYVELIRASGSNVVTQQIKTVLKTHFEDPIIELLDGEGKEVKASLIVAMMMGLMNSLWILEDERLISLSVDQAIKIYGTAIQNIVNQTIS